ncbi:hypothetical protein RJT34_04143 [Clitoria ternatea]|uniref:Uncharacterized protein n=1 Tax=Clitoria ternatea TaxID=43366 RepID=A0AAN9KL27_CLITE
MVLIRRAAARHGASFRGVRRQFTFFKFLERTLITRTVVYRRLVSRTQVTGPSLVQQQSMVEGRRLVTHARACLSAAAAANRGGRLANQIQDFLKLGVLVLKRK